MSAKHWTELSSEAGNVVYKFRELFLREHQRADEILMSKEGIPLKAVYYSCELPGYGKPITDVPVLNQPILKDVTP